MAILAVATTLPAQVPQTFVYQTVVRDADGRLASGRQVGVRVSILRGSATGTAVYTDQQQVQANRSGLITLMVGSQQKPLNGINWASGSYYFRCEADPDGGSNYSHSEVHQLLAVPYAILARTVDSIGHDQYAERDPLFLAWGKNYLTLINQPTLFSGRYADLRNLPTLFSGSYLDLTDTPTLPTIPTLISAFTNDVGYITSYTERQSLASAVTLGNAAGGQLKSVSDPIDPLDVVNLRTLDSSLNSIKQHYDSVLSRRQRVLDSLLAATCFTTYGDTTAIACGGFTWLGHSYTSSGNFYQVITNAAGCDSIVSLHLTLHLNRVTATVQCESYTWSDGTGQTYTTSGDYTFTHTNTDGCTQVDTLHLTINYPAHTATTAIACGDYAWHSQSYTSSGTYTYTHADGNGCTQVDTLHLTINHPAHIASTATACDSYTWTSATGTTYTASGNYLYSHTDGNGCTQVDTLHLTINNPMHAALTQASCESYTWTAGNGTTYASSGNYTHNHTDAHGCTQVDTLHLTINHPAHTALTQVACESYTWSAGNGNTYTSTGHYTHSHTDAHGCTQVDTLHLTINSIVSTATTEAACESYTWTAGNGNTYTFSGHYTYSHTDANGCIQVDTLHLTINNPAHAVSTASVCDSYTWTGGNGNTYTVSGHYTYSHTDANGCMQIDTLHLTINQSSISDATATACESFTWHGTTYTASGDYFDTLTNAAGCDSVLTLHLTLHPYTRGFDANGASLSSFSVAAGRTVHFSRGNLQYNAALGTHATNGGGTAQGTWRFALHQYDTICSNNRSASSSYNGWIDLFGWGTSGWNSGNTYYQPWCTASDVWSQYGPAGDYDLTGIYANADWGVYNAISNGGNTPGQWRTLTANEWQYLFNTRPASTLNGTTNARYAKASVADIHGVILFPDAYSHPSSVPLPAGINATGNAGWNSNRYTAANWTAMEAAGAVFLPATGYRIDDMTGESGEGVHYWSATSGGDSYAYRASIRSYSFDAAYNGGRLDGIAVRLVKADVIPCTTTYGDTSATSAGCFNWHRECYPTSGDYRDTLTTTAGCDSVVTLHLTITPTPTPTTTTWVDLGLPSGLLWAECNLGATTPEGYGNHYAWGEIISKCNYSWGNYSHANGDWDKLTKYIPGGDNLVTLEAMDDAATQTLGSGARIPTKDEWQELVDNTTGAWTTRNGVNGYFFTAANGNSLFLPAAGEWYGSYYNTYYANGIVGTYWSSSLDETLATNAWFFSFFYADGTEISSASEVYGNRDDGFSVRAVRAGTTVPTCTTYGDTAATAAGNFNWHRVCYSASGDYRDTLTNAGGCDSVVTLYLTITNPPATVSGELPGLFSVADGRKVKFSQGHLQFNATQGTHTTNDCSIAQGTWRFASTQYDTWTTEDSAWIGTFCWGTSGWNSGANRYMPTDTSSSATDFYPGGSYTNDLTGDYANADWGVYNAISNGGNAPGLWRTLTYEEWRYIFATRQDASSKFALGLIDGIIGLIILPDDFTLPEGCSFTPGSYSTYYNGLYLGSASNNSYSLAQWSEMEAAGAVFFKGDSYDHHPPYWSASHYTGTYGGGDIPMKATRLAFNHDYMTCSDGNFRNDPSAVRLVRDVEDTPAGFVDLGLPSGLLWAECNLGATTPEGYGNYYAWGETSPKSTYDWSTYAYCNGSYGTLTKYCGFSGYGYNGFTDALTTLQAMDDAATQALGSGTRTPTADEWIELLNNTTATWTTRNGVYGRLFTAANGNSIFLPAAGYRYGSSLTGDGSNGYYWSSSLNEIYPSGAWCFDLLYFYSSYQLMYYYGRRGDGFSVRAVCSSSLP